MKREGNFTRSGYEVLDETYLFKGDENSLMMTQSYTHDFQCVYQLQKYPFDTQVGSNHLIRHKNKNSVPFILKECSIDMNVKPGDYKSVTLLPLDKTIKQSLDMVLFTITNFDLVSATVPGEGIRMTITLKRKIMSEMMTTYFPSLLLMMIT